MPLGERGPIEQAVAILGLPMRTVQDLPRAAKSPARRRSADNGHMISRNCAGSSDRGAKTWQSGKPRPDVTGGGIPSGARLGFAGNVVRWSLDTDDPALAKARRQAGKERAVADAFHGDARRSFEEAFTAWDAQLLRTVGPKTAKRYCARWSSSRRGSTAARLPKSTADSSPRSSASGSDRRH